jgi:hypothetical protein
MLNQQETRTPINVLTVVRLRIVEVFPQAIPIFEEAKPGQWRRAA